jgi:hypothetical protein
MPSLVTGSIKLADCDDYCAKKDGGSCFSDNDTCEICGANNDGSGDCVILNGLSEAECLELTAEPSVVCLHLLLSELVLLFFCVNCDRLCLLRFFLHYITI